MLITTTPYKPRNPELLRILSTEDYENIQTPKSSPIKLKDSSPLPPDTILGKNSFGINFNRITKQHSIGKKK